MDVDRSIWTQGLTREFAGHISAAIRSPLIDGWKARPLLIGAGVVLAFATFTGILALRQARRATQLG
jgi:hypothetical protein